MINDHFAHQQQVVDLLDEMLASLSLDQALLLKPIQQRMTKRLARMDRKARKICRDNARQAAKARKSFGFLMLG